MVTPQNWKKRAYVDGSTIFKGSKPLLKVIFGCDLFKGFWSGSDTFKRALSHFLKSFLGVIYLKAFGVVQILLIVGLGVVDYP